MEKKVTLYKSLAKKFKEMGFKVNKGSWVESVGYDIPTKEYWFDITIKKSKKVETTLHFYFNANKNNTPEVQMWETTFKVDGIIDKRLL